VTSTPRCPACVSSARLTTAFDLPGLVIVDDDVVGDEVVAGLRAAIASSKLTGTSQLDGGFAATRGFGVSCHVDAVADAVSRVPLVGPFVDVALDARLLSRLLRPNLVERAAAAIFGLVNALYLNVLVVPPGAGVGRHVDATLGVATAGRGDDRPLPPRAVVVLYVDVPDGIVGGELRLFAGDDVVAAVAPRTGRLVVFRGALGHEVTPVSTSTGARVSCVAELYALPRRRLRRLPRVRLQSHGFAAVMDRLRRPEPSPAPGSSSTPT
jgi:hypothetical protein